MQKGNDFKAVKGQRHLYVSRYKTKRRGWVVSYVAVMRWWDGEDRRKNLGQNKDDALARLRELEDQNANHKPFESTREARARVEAEEERQRNQVENVMTLRKWSALCLDLSEVKAIRSFDRTKGLHVHLLRHLGEKKIADIDRDDLFDYIKKRRAEGIVRGGKQSEEHMVQDGTIKNELAALRRALRLARDYRETFAKKHNIVYDAPTVSFREVLPEAESRERIFMNNEESRFLAACAPWFRRLVVVSMETCLGRGELLRLKWSEVHDAEGVIIPTKNNRPSATGRKKTGERQVSPLTDNVREVLREIRAEQRALKVQPINDLVFTRDGRPITGGMVCKARYKALRDAKIVDFHFHDLRHVAKTRWADAGIHPDVAMKGAGHTSVEMHMDYTNMQRANVAKAFGTAKKFDNSFTTAEDDAKAEAAG